MKRRARPQARALAQTIRGQRKAVSRRPTMIDVANEARVSQTAVRLSSTTPMARAFRRTRDRVLGGNQAGYQPVRRGGAPGSAARASPPHLRRDVNRSLDGDRP